MVPCWKICICVTHSSFFGHFSHRSEWQLIKIDYKGLFSRRCMDGDYQTWHLHNKVPGILNVIDLLSTSRDACLPVVSLNSGYLARAFPISFRSLPLKKKKKSGSSFSLFDRESSVWWARSRSIWNGGQATVACWPRTIQGSIHQNPASARPMILNGIYFHSHISSTRTVCEFRPFYTVILEFLSLHVYQTARPPFERLIRLHLITASCIHLSGKTEISVYRTSFYFLSPYCIFTA